ncbi:MAG: DUF4055 domain-containing protein [Elainellaceae cyanobacterium]
MSTNDPRFPDFQCGSYRSQLGRWRYLDAVYRGRDAWTERSPDGRIQPNDLTRFYLPQAPRERAENYSARVCGTAFLDKYAQAIKDFVGLIFSNGVRFIDVPDQVLECLGEPKTFLMGRAIASMRRGHSLVLVDAPVAPGRSLLDAATVRPRCVPIDNYQVLNWRYTVVGDRKVLTQATIKESSIVIDGAFGEREDVTYLVLTPGRYDRFRIIERGSAMLGVSEKRELQYLPERSGNMGYWSMGQFVPLGFVPLFGLRGGQDEDDNPDPLVSTAPLMSLADLNVVHYQVSSDHLNKIKKTCRPVYVRVGAMGDEDELVISSDTTVDVPPGGGFMIVEPQANSIVQSRAELEAIESLMDFLGASFMVKPSDRQAAMVSLIQVSKVESGLTLFASSFVDGVNQILMSIGLYLGLAPQQCGRVELETKFFQQAGVDGNLLTAYTGFFESLTRMPSENAAILLRLLEARGYLSDRTTADDIMKNLSTLSNQDENKTSATTA